MFLVVSINKFKSFLINFKLIYVEPYSKKLTIDGSFLKFNNTFIQFAKLIEKILTSSFLITSISLTIALIIVSSIGKKKLLNLVCEFL